MINIDDNLRQLYKNDSLPNVSELSYKQLFLYFPGLNLTITNDPIVFDSFRLEESLCSESDLIFGSCESAQLKVTVADVVQDLKGQEMIVTQVVNGIYQMPLGTYKVESAKKQADLRFKDIVAYDRMAKFDIDVSAWYNGLSYPITLRDFRLGLCAYIGVEAVEQTLPNDSMQITKTISPTVLSGRDVLRRIAEINGTFGRITRYNKLKLIGLSNLGLYPSETLYPAEDLFPAESSEFLGSAGYKDSQYEEYEVQSIEKLQIREQEGDIGVTVGIGTNGYIIEGNFLVYGMSTAELTTVANNLFLMIKNKKYRPHTTNVVGLPYIEVGDAISIVTTTDVIETFVFKRVLTGVQALNDEISASGSEMREQDFGIATEIEQLKGQNVKITKEVGKISFEIDGPDGIWSQILQQAQEISLRVTSDAVDNKISVAISGIKLKANQIDLEGYTSINGKFAVLSDGTAQALEMQIANIEPIGSYTTCRALNITTQALLIEGKFLYEMYSRITHTHFNLMQDGSELYWNGSKLFAWNTQDLGDSTHRFGTVYLSSAPSVSSDRNAKHAIADLDDAYKRIIKECRPVIFKYNDGTSDRYHTGFVAQDVEELLNRIGLDPKDFAGLIKSPRYSECKEDGDFDPNSQITGYVYSLRYEEFIAPAVAVIQDQERELKELKALLKEKGVI